MASVLSLDALTLCYGGFVAVDSLCLRVERGEIYGLLGPNGCGKSTSLAAIVGTIAPVRGEIRVAGRRACEDSLAYRRFIGLVPQELALFDELTAEQNVSFFGRLYGLAGQVLKRRVADVLDFVCLSEHARRCVRIFSGGMQRRLNLACALVHEPPLLLLDEPTVGLDIQSRDAIFASLRQLCGQGTAIVFTTHHLEEAELLCDRIGIMDHGRLIAEGTLDQLCAACPAEATSRWRLDGPHGLTGPHRAARLPGLERVFLQLTGRSLRES
jgi:ABC-2 type transport system ATP-binding protein